MRWIKLGRLYSPESSHPKLATHASNPVAVLREGNIYRVFFSGRDSMNRSSVGFVDIDIVERRALDPNRTPVFEYGSGNSFYADGVSLGNCYEVDGRRYLLFMGWRRSTDGHWQGTIGRLVLKSDFSLYLDDENPLMSSDASDPVSLSYPWVIRHEDRSYSMWYGSTITWDAGNGEMLHPIKCARSNDGRHWQRKGVAVPYEIGVAQAFSRPSVIAGKQGYQMWFSYRGAPIGKYRIGYAISSNGEDWSLRLNEAGIDAST